uniref:Uncharacterized protein n=1 Tax=Rhizophora mucronata TaxID=61149 RepID=A0A2P2MKE1_RHIMU
MRILSFLKSKGNKETKNSSAEETATHTRRSHESPKECPAFFG